MHRPFIGAAYDDATMRGSDVLRCSLSGIDQLALRVLRMWPSGRMLHGSIRRALPTTNRFHSSGKLTASNKCAIRWCACAACISPRILPYRSNAIARLFTWSAALLAHTPFGDLIFSFAPREYPCQSAQDIPFHPDPRGRASGISASFNRVKS